MEQERQERTPIPVVSLTFTLMAGIWMAMGPILGHMGRPWPCLLGAVTLFGASMVLFFRPRLRLETGLVILMAALFVFMLGSEGVIPGLLGIVGGAVAVASRETDQSINQSIARHVNYRQPKGGNSVE